MKKLFLILILATVSFPLLAESPRFCTKKHMYPQLYKYGMALFYKKIGLRGDYIEDKNEIMDEALGDKKDEIILKKMMKMADYKQIVDKVDLANDEKAKQAILIELYDDDTVKRICGK